MSFLITASRHQLELLAEELMCDPTPGMGKRPLISLIKQCEDYEEILAGGMLEKIIKNEAEKERKDKEERERLERAAQREHELNKLRLEGEISMRASTPDRTLPIQPRNLRELRNLMQKFNPDEIDINLYLTLFERQARKIGLEEGEYVSQLMALLPIEIAQLILREPEHESDHYPYVKKMLLERFKLSPEALRTKFVQHQRSQGTLWKDFVFDLRVYLEGWLDGLQVDSWVKLKDLMITDQLKRRLGDGIRDHFLDEWGNLVSPEKLARMADNYELVRGPATRQREAKGSRDSRRDSGSSSHEGKPEPKKSVSVSEREKEKSPVRDKARSPGRTKVFERRVSPACYGCGSRSHLLPQCPERNKPQGDRNQGTEQVNQIGLVGDTAECLAPFISEAKVNGRKMTILRDSGATIDVLCESYVAPEDYLKEKVRVRQPLSSHTYELPLARVTIEGPYGKVEAKACVIRKDLDQGRYLMGNRTAELISRKEREAKSLVQMRDKTRPFKKWWRKVKSGPPFRRKGEKVIDEDSPLMPGTRLTREELTSSGNREQSTQTIPWQGGNRHPVMNRRRKWR